MTRLHWTDGHADEGNHEVTCGAVISHPCPLLAYATSLTIDGTTATWSDFVGSHDSSGKDVTLYPPYIEPIEIDRGLVTFPQHVDESGLRYAFTLQGGTTTVSWMLDVVPGTTTFTFTNR